MGTLGVTHIAFLLTMDTRRSGSRYARPEGHHASGLRLALSPLDPRSWHSFGTR